MENEDERIERIHKLVSNSSYIKTSDNTSSFTAAQFFDFKVTDEIDNPEHIFEFNGLDDFLYVMSGLPVTMERSKMKEVIINKGVPSNGKFKLTLLLN